MKKDIFLLLGGNIMNYGIIRKYKNRGMYVFVIDWNENPALKGDKHYRIDVKDSKRIIDALKNDNYWQRVYFSYSSIDLAVPSVARINKELGLSVIDEKGIENSSSKSNMIAKWKNKGILNRYSFSYREFSEDIYRLNCSKIIVKPDNSSSSRGITVLEKNSEEQEVKCAFEKAQREATNNLVVVEEYIEGIEYTVEMIGDAYGNVCVYGVSQKYHTSNTDNNRIAVKLHYNSISEELQRRIADFGIKCYKALDFSSSLGHLEVLMKDNGTLCPVEIAARSSGNIASDLVDVVSGVSFLDELIEVHNGKMVTNGFHPQTNRSSMYFFYDFPAGSYILNESNILEYCNKEICSRFFDRRFLKVGTRFEKIHSDNGRYGYEVLEGPKTVLTADHIIRAEKDMMEEMLGYE